MKTGKENDTDIDCVLRSIEETFLREVKPVWDEMEKRTYRRGNVTIVFPPENPGLTEEARRFLITHCFVWPPKGCGCYS